MSDGRMDERAAALARQHFSQARDTARCLAAGRPHLRDDLESAAMLGLCQAAMRYDPARGVRFATFADRRIKGAIGDALREARPRGFSRALAWPEIVSIDPGMAREDGELSDAVAYEDESAAGVEYQDLVDRLAAELGSGCRDLWRRLHGHAASAPLRAAGAAFELSESGAWRINEVAAAALRRRFSEPGAAARVLGGPEGEVAA